jgi:hypothetical protein
MLMNVFVIVRALPHLSPVLPLTLVARSHSPAGSSPMLRPTLFS